MHVPTTRDEDGFTMVSVVLIGLVLFILAGVMTARTISDNNQVTGQRQDERALQVADSAIDRTLFKLYADSTYTTGESPLVASCLASPAAEEACARQIADTAPANRVVTVDGGQWVAIKPTGGASVIYAVGYTPARQGARQSRVIRAEYDFSAFSLQTAILSGGNIDISGNPAISGAQGNIHANGNVFSGGGSPSYSGYVSASGTFSVSCSPGCVGNDAASGGGKPTQEVPVIDPRQHFPLAEYVLCTTGKATPGPLYPGGGYSPIDAAGACASGPSLPLVNGAYRNWKKTGDDASAGAKWDYSGNTAADGSYYIQEGSAYVSGNPGEVGPVWNVSIFAEATVAGGHSPAHCTAHKGGDISFSGNPAIAAYSKSRPLLLIAGRDLKISGNGGSTTNYDAVLGAHEQFTISGNPTIRGAIVVNDACNSASSLVADGDTEISGNPIITYDGTAEAPFGRTIRTTRWEEL